MRQTILFVERDSEMRATLERTLVSLRDRWALHFVADESDALAFLAATPCDVVVMDPGALARDGGSLLARVRMKYPQALRILALNGSPTSIEMFGVVHQYLSKPYDAEEFEATIVRGLILRRLLEKESLQRIVSRMQTLPGLPKVYLSLLAELRKPHVSLQKVGRIIQDDIAVTAKVLQVVNSAYFGVPRRITNPIQAVGLLGLSTVKMLVLSVHMFSQFKIDQFRGFDLNALWNHCTNVGLLARNIAQYTTGSPQVADDAMAAGLLHDAGKLILATHLPVQYAQVSQWAREEKRSLHEAELSLIGTTHAEVGAALLAIWGLPETVVEATAYHHRPREAQMRRSAVLAAVHVANVVERRQNAQAAPETRTGWDEEYLRGIDQLNEMEAWVQRYRLETEWADAETRVP